MDCQSNVQIAIRARPVLPSIDASDSSVDECVVDVNEPQRQVIVALEKSYAFDFCFSPETSQAHVFASAVRPLVSQCLESRLHLTLLAYGQTGAGKTHTMLGTHGDPGMIPRVVQQVFEQMLSDQVSIAVAYYEIYNEKPYDLLKNGSHKVPLVLREEGNNFLLPQLTSHWVSSTTEAMQYLEQGNQLRTTGTTAQNKSSSRSHAIFRLTVVPSGAVADSRQEIRFHLVDLAGSESVRKTAAQGERLLEANHINKGLLALGNCISALCHKKAHVPFRDSLLTKVLRECLVSNGRCVMINCISPTERDLAETMSTLRFADRAKDLPKPAIPPDLLCRAQSSSKKRRLASLIPPTPSKRISLNYSLPTPTRSARAVSSNQKTPNSGLPLALPLTSTAVRPILNDISEENEDERNSTSTVRSNHRTAYSSLKSSLLMDSTMLSPVMKKYHQQLEERLFQRLQSTLLSSGAHIRQSAKPASPKTEQAVPDFSSSFLSSKPLSDLSNRDLKKRCLLNQVADTASPNLPRPESRNSTLCQSPDVSAMATVLGVNPDSPLLFEVVEPKVPDTLKQRSSRRTGRRTTMMATELKRSLLGVDVTTRRRSCRIAAMTVSGESSSDFKHPLQSTNHWKVAHQERHNQNMLELLNTANLAMLKSIPAIGPKSAYIIINYRELHQGLRSLQELQLIPGLQKSFFTKFTKIHQIVL